MRSSSLSRVLSAALAVLTAAVVLMISAPASAQSLYWDPTSTGGQSGGGSGTWDTSTPLWYNGTSDVAWDNTADANATAAFTASTGTVTLGTNISVAGLSFINGANNYSIAGVTPATTLTLNGGTINVAGKYAFLSNITLTGAGFTLSNGGGSKLVSGTGNGPVNWDFPAGAVINVQGNGTLVGSSNDDGVWTNNLASLNVGSGATFMGVEANVVVDALTGAGAVSAGYEGGGSITVGAANGSGAFSGVLADSPYPYSPCNLIKTGSGAQVLSGPTTFTGYTTISGGTLQFGDGTTDDGAVASSNILDNGVLVFANPAAQSYAGGISGSGSLVKNGSGTLTLTAALSYTGGTTVNAGNLQLQNGALSSQSIVVNSGGTLEYAGGGGQGLTTLSGAGTLLKSGNNTLAFGTGTGNINWNFAAGAVINVSAGTLVGGSNGEDYWTNNLASLNVASGATFMGVEANVVVDALTGAGVVSAGYGGGGSITVGAANGSGTFSGVIQDSPYIYSPTNFIKSGSGAEVLSGPTAYTGYTTISGGTLQFGDGATDNGGVASSNILDNGVLVFANPAAQSYAGGISGSGSLVKTGSGTLTLTAALSYSGGTTVNGGDLQLQNSVLASQSIVVNSGGTLECAGGGNQTLTTLSGAGTLLKSGNNTLTFGAGAGNTINWNFAAGAVINVAAGTLVGGSNDNDNWTNNFASLNVAAGAVFEGFEAAVRVDALTGAGTVSSGYGGGSSITVGVANGSGTFSGVLEDSQYAPCNLNKTGSGVQVLSGANTYTGLTTISGGTLQIGNGGSGEGLLSSITMSNNATVAFNHSDPLSYGGAISGSGQLIKLGTGVLDLTGTSTYSGPTTISAGTLELDVNGNNLPTATALTIASSGVLDMGGVPQTVGSLSGSAGAIIMNHYSPLYASTLTVAPSSGSTTTFAGNIIGNDALALSGSGQLTLSGTNTYSGGTTVSGGTLDIAAPSALAGSGLVTIAAGGRLVLGSGAGIGALLAASSPVGSDAVALSAAAAPATLGGDESASGNMATLGDAPPRSQGGGGSAVGGSAAAVPEPGTIVLMAAAILMLAIARWRRRR